MKNAERLFSHRIGRVLTALTAMFLWGSAFPMIKWGYDSLQIASGDTGQQILFAGYRFFLAALMILVVFHLLNRRPRFQRETLLSLVWIGLFQTFLQYALFYIGLAYSTGIQGSVIAGTTSFFQILFARWMVPDEPITWRKILGLVIGFGGVVMVNLRQESMEFSLGWGALLLLVAMMSSAFGNLLARKGAARMDVAYLTGYQMLFGSLGLMLTGISLVGWHPFSFNPESGAILFYLAFLSAAGFVLWNNVMKYNPVGKVSMFLFAIPVFGVMLSSLILGETLHRFVLIGLALVAAGIWIVNREPGN
ncbi:DMT family transporter [Kroppenstedtia eburnea]|uniref:DMT family transporter n=1 Tax=Kroppenstedtia eburnea TaxID=714067 RepID=UPI00363FB612